MNVPSLYRKTNLLIIDDEQGFHKLLHSLLRKIDHLHCHFGYDANDLKEQLSKQHIDLILLDLHLPMVEGTELLEWLISEHPNLPVIVITADSRNHLVSSCLKLGAFDFLTKPIDLLRLTNAIQKALEHQENKKHLETFHQLHHNEQRTRPEAFHNIITQNAKMEHIFLIAQAVAQSQREIMISGETGTGKELFAKAIHQASRPEAPFVAINVGGLDDQLFADTLFGHHKGAYTGAQGSREGLFTQAQHGTLFLDEVGDLSPSSQIKLLRVLQEREILPLGSDHYQKIHCRILVASSQSLAQLESKGLFRKDLIYRLRTHQLHIPPLREREDDIPLLSQHFNQLACQQMGSKRREFPSEVIAILQEHRFPGNVRELESIVFNTVALMKEGLNPIEIIKAQLGMSISSSPEVPSPETPFIENSSPSSNDNLHTPQTTETFDRERSRSIDEQEDETTNEAFNHGEINTELRFPEPLPSVDDCVNALIQEALKRHRGNQTQAAKAIQLSRRALINRLQKMQID